MTVTRPFNAPDQSSGLAVAGDVFSVDFVTGYNDAGTSGVSLLTTSGGNVGNFIYHAGYGFSFNNVATGKLYASGVIHLKYTLTSSTAYSFQATGAVTFSGTGTYRSPITGFQFQQTNSAGGDPSHNAYFNNLSLTCVPKTP